MQQLSMNKLLKRGCSTLLRGDMHESVCANGEARGANHMDNTKILGLDLKEVLRWHIYECIARG